MRLLALLAPLALSGCAMSAQSVRESAASESRTSASLVAYGQQSQRQAGELRVPAGKGPFPVAMVIHGGCYVGIGSRDGFAPMAEWLRERDVASWSISYRDLGSGPGYPDTFNDWAAGLAKLKELAKKNRLDLTRLTVIGHSAGTTGATWLASGSRGDGVLERDLPDVRAAVVLDGPVGLAEWIGIDERICDKPVIVPFMGGTPAQFPARYAMVDPRTNPLRVKELLVVDAALPAPKPDALDAIRSKGVKVEVVKVSQDDHFNLMKPGHPDFEAYAQTLLRIAKGE